MKKNLSASVLGLAAAMAFAITAEAADYSLNVANFCELTVVDGVKVDYVCSADSAGLVVFSAEPEVASKITFSNNKEHLRIQSAADEHPLSDLPKVTVYSASLRSVENSGDSLVRVFVNIPVQKFKARQIGNGTLEIYGVQAEEFDGDVAAGRGSLKVEGKSVKAKFKNVSSGPIDASRLDVYDVNCFIFGAGNIDCAPSRALKVLGAGGGKVYYHVTPGKITNRSLGVKAQARTEEPSSPVGTES